MLGMSFYKFEVIMDSPFGRGIVAKEKIVAGEIICKMTGPVMTLNDICMKYSLNETNPMQIDKNAYMDLLEPYVIFNHSCDPNAGIKNDGVLFALKDIKVDEEIFYDYSTTSDDLLWSMECMCGAKNCRKIVSDFQSIPHERKEYYLSKNAVTSHIKRIYC